MNKRLIILGALCSGLFMSAALSAQEPLVRKANSPEGKPMTMEEAVWLRNLTPAMERFSFKESEAEYPMAFTQGNNLYVRRDSTSAIDTITRLSDRNFVAGQTVSRNEFGIEGGIFWSPDKSMLAYYIKDESRVTDFPLFDITSRTGSTQYIKYPMAGMDSERLSLNIWNPSDGTTSTIDHVSIATSCGWARPEETYITNVCWSPDGTVLYAQLLDRSQRHSLLCAFGTNGNLLDKYGKGGIILSEDNDKYVEPLDPLYFIKGQKDMFIYRTANRDGYRSLYLCDNMGNISRITKVPADVEYIANDGKWIYYTSAEVSPIENHLFRIGISNLKKGVMKAKYTSPQRLTNESGWHHITMNRSCTQFVDHYSSICVPRVQNLCNADGSLIRNIYTAQDPTLEYSYGEITLGSVRSADGKYDNYYRLIKPADFDPSKKYPLIVYVYGGPHSQMVRNTFCAELRRWEMYMAQRGYIVYVQDNRGTSNRGLDYEQAIWGQCGQAEMADQMVGVRALMELPYIDTDRVGVHGWSYGGFMTISLITNYPEVFKVGVAGGPVIDWKWYEVMYGERYMGNPEENADGYAKTSLIAKAKDLKGKLLICQGVIDPVVVWENSLSFVRECVKNNVQVDYFPYPRAEHNVMGKDRVHLMDKVSIYFNDYL